MNELKVLVVVGAVVLAALLAGTVKMFQLADDIHANQDRIEAVAEQTRGLAAQNVDLNARADGLLRRVSVRQAEATLCVVAVLRDLAQQAGLQIQAPRSSGRSCEVLRRQAIRRFIRSIEDNGSDA